MNEKLVAVTGGSGKAGKWIIKELMDHGFDVVNLDRKQPDQRLCRTIEVDLNDLGQTVNALSAFGGRERRAVEAVIHFAGMPQAYTYPNDAVFRNNVVSAYNVLEACAILQIRKAVIASCESAYGFCFAANMVPPKYLPIDESHAQLPEDSCGLSKAVNELTAQSFHRRTGMQVVSFRLAPVIEPSEYAQLRATLADPGSRLRYLWSYIDVRDVAAACRMAVEKDGLGAVALNLVADDTSSDVPTQQLIETYLPSVPMSHTLASGRASLVSNEQCKQLLGWRQQYFLQEDADY